MVSSGITLETLLGGADPHEVIRHDLVETVLDENFQETTKFRVNGHPDVLVRLNDGTPPDEVQAAADAINAMPPEIPRLPHYPWSTKERPTSLPSSLQVKNS